MFLKAEKISKTYSDMARPVGVLSNLEFELKEGELVGIFGASGSGKSTLLHILGGLDTPTAGSVLFEDRDIDRMSADELASFRNKEVGFVFQFYHLLAEFTAVENVMLPALIAGRSKTESYELAKTALEAMGLKERLLHRPSMLSGGEQQRVAIARASVMRPKVIFADEPTGNLDHITGDQIFNYLLGLMNGRQMAMVLVTHNRDLVQKVDTAYELVDGKLKLVTEQK